MTDESKTKTKKVAKKESKKSEEKKKSGKATPKRKSSASSSKKSKSPTHSQDEIQIENIPTESKEKSIAEPGLKDQNRSNIPPPSDFQPPPLQFNPRLDLLLPGGSLTQQPKPQPIRNCIHHNQQLKYYCEACEVPTCTDCHSLGPHNTELHRVASISEAFTSRYDYLVSGNYKLLTDKRDRLIAQLNRIDNRIRDIQSAADYYDRDVKTEYAGILERLKSAEGQKTAILQHDMAELQKDIERIDSIFDTLDMYLQGELKEDLVGFLIKFREIHEYIEFAISKPFKAKVDIVPNDLPRDLKRSREMIEKSAQGESLLKLKDEIIWTLIQEKKKLTDIAKVDIDKAYQYEWNEWAKLINKYSEELEKYNLVCHYCGISLDSSNVNSVCSDNSEENKLQSSFLSKGTGVGLKRYTANEPPYDFRGNGQHFFGKQYKLQEVQRSVFDPRATNVFQLIKSSGIDKYNEMKRRIIELDKEQKGEIEEMEFKEILKGIYNLNEESLRQLIETIINPSNRKIQYIYFFKKVEPEISLSLSQLSIREDLKVKEDIKESTSITY